MKLTILIDHMATLSYVSPKIVEQCKLQRVKFKNLSLAQLPTRAKRGVLTKVTNCLLQIARQPIMPDLNVLPLGSYDILIEMDQLEKHWSLLNCKTKTINYMDEDEEKQEI